KALASPPVFSSPELCCVSTATCSGCSLTWTTCGAGGGGSSGGGSSVLTTSCSIVLASEAMTSRSSSGLISCGGGGGGCSTGMTSAVSMVSMSLPSLARPSVAMPCSTRTISVPSPTSKASEFTFSKAGSIV